jgi:hypothetical protein
LYVWMTSDIDSFFCSTFKYVITVLTTVRTIDKIRRKRTRKDFTGG